jgi:type IV pilus assembly protein PilM
MAKASFSSSQAVLSGFPVPAFLSFPAAGLEISEHSLKHLSFSGRSQLEVESYGNWDLSPGIIVGGEIQDAAALCKALTALRPAIGTAYVHVSLPEQKGYIFRTMVAKGSELSPREAIEFRIEENVPLPPSEIVFDCEELPAESTDTEYAVNVTAFPRATVESYYAALQSAGLMPLSFELESQAAARSLLPRQDTEARMLVDFGETRTVIAVAERGIVRFTTSLELAGGSLGKALEKIGIADPVERERVKNEEGLAGLTEQSAAAQALLPVISSLRDELNRHFVYWRTHGETTGALHLPITSVVLFGGNSNLRGLSEYLSASLKVDVSLAEVWRNAFPVGDRIPPITFKQSLRFATVAGLALRRGIQNT